MDLLDILERNICSQMFVKAVFIRPVAMIGTPGSIHLDGLANIFGNIEYEFQKNLESSLDIPVKAQGLS